MSLSADKKRTCAEQKFKSVLNKSTTKALYSFSKAERFPARMYRSAAEIRTYDIEMKKYDKKISFTTTQRTNFCRNDGIPGPTKYDPIKNPDKRLSVQFKNGRQQCKANSVFQTNYNPGPGKYEPKSQIKYKTVYYSLGKRLSLKKPQTAQTPGPIYKIQSTLLDKNKFLSIYVRRNSTRICQPRPCFSRKPRQTTQIISNKPKESSQTAYITRNGGKQFGKSGPFPFQSSSKRLFQCSTKDQNPGPGQYKSFSEFIDENVQSF